MRRLIAWVLGWRVVALRDFDGEVVFRLAEPTPFGLRCFRMSRCFRIGGCMLIDGGVVVGSRYVEEWRPA